MEKLVSRTKRNDHTNQRKRLQTKPPHEPTQTPPNCLYKGLLSSVHHTTRCVTGAVVRSVGGGRWVVVDARSRCVIGWVARCNARSLYGMRCAMRFAVRGRWVSAMRTWAKILVCAQDRRARCAIGRVARCDARSLYGMRCADLCGLVAFARCGAQFRV